MIVILSRHELILSFYSTHTWILKTQTPSSFFRDQKGMWFFHEYLAWQMDSSSSLKDVKTGISISHWLDFTPTSVNLYSFTAFSYFKTDVRNWILLFSLDLKVELLIHGFVKILDKCVLGQGRDMLDALLLKTLLLSQESLETWYRGHQGWES